jgi:hypothetical protein
MIYLELCVKTDNYFDLLRNGDKMCVSERCISTECGMTESYCPVFIIGK